MLRLVIAASIMLTAALTSPCPAGSSATTRRTPPAFIPGENITVITTYETTGYKSINARSARILRWPPYGKYCTVWYVNQADGESATVEKSEIMRTNDFEAMIKRVETEAIKSAVMRIYGIPISPLEPKGLPED